MAVKLVTKVLLVLLLVAPVWAYALGLGEIKLRSALEEPFDAEIELTSASDSVLKTLQVKLASEDDFSRVGIKPVAAVKLLNFKVVKKTAGGVVVHVTTQEPIHDPYLNFLIEANWGRGRALREYTVLLDPPELAGEDTPVIDAPAIATVEPEAVEPPAVAGVLEVEPPPVVAAVVEMPDELPSVAEDGLLEPELLPFLDDEGLIEPEVIEPEPLPEVAEPGLLEPESLPPVAEDDLIEPELLPEIAEAELIEPELEEIAESAVAETEVAAAPEQDSFPDVDDVLVGSEELSTATESVVTGESAPLAYSVERGDTLWSIAEQMRGDQSVSVYQVMMALFHNNRHAFIGDNVNNLKAGSILRVEDEGELSAVSSSTAKSEFWQQYRAWQDYRQMLAENVVTQGETMLEAGSEVVLSDKTYSAEEVAHLAEASIPVQQGAQLKLVSPEEVAPAADTAGGTTESGEDAAASVTELQTRRDELLAEIEGSEAGSAENQALREQLAALEEQIASLQRAVSVEDTELAAMQQQVAEEAIQQPESADSEQPAEEGLMAKLNRSPQLMGILGGAILLLLAWLWIMFRRRGKEDDAQAAVVSPEESSALADDEPEFLTSESEPDDEVLLQADAFVEDGKYAAAAEILTEAVKQNPDNEAYRYRLLEIHSEMKNKDAFSREAEELYSLTGGLDASRWGKVVAMGAVLLPAHALFSGGSDLPDVDREFSGAEETETGEWDDIELEADLDAKLDKSVSAAGDENDQHIGEVLGDNAGTALTGDSSDDLEQDDTAESSDSTWDVDFEMDEAEETSETFALEEEILDDAGSEPGSDTDLGIDFNLPGGADVKVAAAGAAAAGLAGAVGGDVLEFSRREEELSETEAEQLLESGQALEPESGAESADLETSSQEKEVAPGLDDIIEDELDDDEQSFPSFSEYDSMAEDDELLDDVDEIGTKLDLARAYIDMGDPDAARSMLDEVKSEGDDIQKKEATELLGQISG